MPITNKPYLPFYVKDWLSSTKLRSCSAMAHGIMINFMALCHMEEPYGAVLLKQKFKQSDKQINNFACQLAKILPFTLLEIVEGLTELIEEKALVIEGDSMICPRMVKDADLSEKRAKAGSKGGERTTRKASKPPENEEDFAQANAQAKSEANTAIANAIANDTVILNSKYLKDEKFEKEILQFFGFNEINNFDKLKIIAEACFAFYNSERLEYFRNQFKFYKSVKAKEDVRYRHSLSNFLGDQSETFNNGAWNSRNWEEEFKNLGQKSSQQQTPSTYTKPSKSVNHKNL
jgi:hypothetical protein